MFDENSRHINSASPSTPVSVLGLSTTPFPGERFDLQPNEKSARAIASERKVEQSIEVKKPKQSLEDIFAQYSSGERSELALIVKVDVLGSLQPITDSLNNLAEQAETDISLEYPRR